VSQFDINCLYKADMEVTVPTVTFKQGTFAVASTMFVKLSCSLFESGFMFYASF
jgi:hypothetical protein